MQTIPLTAGDIRWIFPDLADTSEVLEILTRADEQIRQLSRHLAVPSGWAGSGLEFHRYDAGTDLVGQVGEEVTFQAGLAVPRTFASQQRPGPPWEVETAISVRCDAPVDCGTHVIEEMPIGSYESPVDAANALLASTTWLLTRGTSEPPASWRQRDHESGHAG